MKPQQTLLFMLTCMLCLGVIMLSFPKGGIQMAGGLQFQFPTFSEMFVLDTTEEKSIDDILAVMEDTNGLAVDSTAIKSRMEAIADSILKVNQKLQYKNNDKSVLYGFFKSLDEVKAKKTKIRVMHYGDSQIEGDRISGYFRNKLQSKFGGRGPGLVAAVPLVNSRSISQTCSEDWKRYTLYGKRDTLVKHNRYGMLANFGRFSPIVPDSLMKDTVYTGIITFKTSYIGFSNTRSFSKAVMYYGYNRAPVTLTVKAGEAVLGTYTLPANKGYKRLEIPFKSTPNNFSFEFSGKDSPDIYGISFESGSGVMLDNIALRGSSGTLFSKINKQQLQSQYDNLNIKLMILQFGGNVIPYIKNKKKAESYGRWFKSQMYRLKAMNPGVNFIVIGPADMSVKEKSEYVTHPYLEDVRNELKAATFEVGGAYFDMYEAMGGKNSMPLWVKADPTLAAKDYIHFNHRGARKVAELIYRSLEDDYNEYKKTH